MRTMKLLIVAALAMASLLQMGTPAGADSVGCTLVPGGPGAYQCLGLYGSGSYLRSTRVTQNAPYGSGNLCRTRAKWTGPLGTTYSSYRAGCVFNTAWFDWSVNRNAPGKWCGTMRSQMTGDTYPSPACNRVG